jgi:hypothetical protein
VGLLAVLFLELHHRYAGGLETSAVSSLWRVAGYHGLHVQLGEEVCVVRWAEGVAMTEGAIPARDVAQERDVWHVSRPVHRDEVSKNIFV